MSKVLDVINNIIATRQWAKPFAELTDVEKFKKVTGIDWVTEDYLNDEANESRLLWMIASGQNFPKNVDNSQEPVDPDTPDEPGDEPGEEKSEEEQLAEALETGGATLSGDLEPVAPLNMKANDAVLELGGNTITTAAAGSTDNKYGDGINVSGNNVVIKGGKIDNSGSAPDGAAIMCKASCGKLTLDDLEVESNGFPVYLNGASNDVTIKSGKYVANNSTAAVYVAKQGGKLTVEGGEFQSYDYNGKNFCLNLKDGLPIDSIQVKGGTFHGFNPAASMGEPNGPVSFVADGYKSVRIAENTWQVVSNETELAEWTAPEE